MIITLQLWVQKFGLTVIPTQVNRLLKPPELTVTNLRRRSGEQDVTWTLTTRLKLKAAGNGSLQKTFPRLPLQLCPLHCTHAIHLPLHLWLSHTNQGKSKCKEARLSCWVKTSELWTVWLRIMHERDERLTI